jgi:hypothetical protein
VLTGIPVITNKIYYAETALVKQHPTGKSIFVCVTALEAPFANTQTLFGFSSCAYFTPPEHLILTDQNRYKIIATKWT